MAHKKPIKRPKWKPYMIAYSLLYGEFVWFERHIDGSITLPVRKMCSQMKCGPKELKAILEWLYEIGGLTSLQWHGHWALVKPAVPLGMERRIEAHVDVENGDTAKAVTQIITNQYEFEEEA